MRALHQIRLHEKFIASGVYQYMKDAQLAGVFEHWSIHQLPDASQIIRVDRDGRQSAFRVSLLSETLRAADGHIERCDIRLYYPADDVMREARATYIFSAAQVEIGRILSASERFDEIMALPPNTVIYPLGRIFTASVIKQLVAQDDGKAMVFVPNITDLHSERLLAGMVEERSARFLGDETIELNSKTVASKRYQFIGGSYTPDSMFWVDEHDTLLRYRYPAPDDHTWTVTLTQYARKP
jgi:hypothetical protein